MRVQVKRYLFFVCLFLLLTGCANRKQNQNAETFILLLTDCKTYSDATTDSDFLEKKFKDYFTGEGYDKFLADKIHYIYPQLFYMEEAQETKVVRIQNTKVTKAGECKVLEYEMKYALEGKAETQFLEDDFKITVNKEGKIEDFLVLNTSDSMHKLVLDVKIY